MSRVMQRVPHAYSDKIRQALRMSLEPNPNARATAEDIALPCYIGFRRRV